MTLVKINDNFEITEGATYELNGKFKCKITSPGVLLIVRPRCIGLSKHKHANVEAWVEDSIALAGETGSIARAYCSGAKAIALADRSTAEAWVICSTAEAYGEYSKAIQMVDGAIAKSFGYKARVFKFKKGTI